MGLLDILATEGKKYIKDAMPGGLLNQEVTPQGLLDTAALATMPVPVLGDAVGLGADAYRLAKNPEERTPLNFGLAALGALPFIPSGMMKAEKIAEAIKPPRADALEVARQNAVKMLGLPENNTAMDRAMALGFTDDTFHATFNRFDNFDLSKASPRSQYMPGIFTADKPELADNYGDYIMPLLQRKGVTVVDKLQARKAGLPAPTVDTIYDKAAGIRVTDNPANIRSRFAAFDPARVNENDLLGRSSIPMLGLLGAGSAAGSYFYNQNK